MNQGETGISSMLKDFLENIKPLLPSIFYT